MSCCQPPTYSCPCAPPGYIIQPYHLPGYTGHIPTLKARNGRSFGNTSRDIIEDPCVALAPCPVLQPPACPCPCPPNPVGCTDLGCFDPICCPAAAPTKQKSTQRCEPPPIPPCCTPCFDPRATHLNRGPYACPCRPEPSNEIYRCCESVSPSYAGYVPGFTFHSTGRTTGVATFGTKQYMQNCLYKNTFLR